MPDTENHDPEQAKAMSALQPYFERLHLALHGAIRKFQSETSALARAEYDDRAATSAI